MRMSRLNYDQPVLAAITVFTILSSFASDSILTTTAFHVPISVASSSSSSSSSAAFLDLGRSPSNHNRHHCRFNGPFHSRTTFNTSTSISTRRRRAFVQYMSWFQQKQSSPKAASGQKINNSNEEAKIQILEKIGSGSYGTVHYCKFDPSSQTDDDGNHQDYYVAKRAWTFDELKEKQKDLSKDDEKKLQQRAQRCSNYLNVEQHCLEKIQMSFNDDDDDDDDDDNNSQGSSTMTPNFVGRFQDCESNHEWIVCDLISSSVTTIAPSSKSSLNNQDDDETKILTPPKAARSLNNAIFTDWKDQHQQLHGNDSDGDDDDDDKYHHHLYMIQKELYGNDTKSPDTTFETTLDVLMTSLLQVISKVHEQNIIHRDVKPDNILIDGKSQSLVLIDFGSAADLDPVKSRGTFFETEKRIGLEDSIVAVSPIYAAPETFVKVGKGALTFDVFSVGLIFCQLLFNLLDERTDAGFHQQLEEANYDLDVWLEREMQSTIRPAGFEDGMFYLAERIGLWKLMKKMLAPDPLDRISSSRALKRFQSILGLQEDISRAEIDGIFFDSVISGLDVCTFSSEELETNGNEIDSNVLIQHHEEVEASNTSELNYSIPRPLHYIATFDRQKSLGLVLSETGTVDEEDEENEELQNTKNEWETATLGARDGEVFVRQIVKDGQADQLGIIQVGDRLVGVGEFPFPNSGFEGFLEMLYKVPKKSSKIKVNFDRESKLVGKYENAHSITTKNVRVSSHGAWSTTGKRKSNEDRFVLQEINDGDLPVLVAAVFDGHGGDAASKTASQILPSVLSTQLSGNSDLLETLESAWDVTCDSYRDGCSIYGECVADYDRIEGILYAGTGSKDLVAGTTAAIGIISLDPDKDELVVLNCGDSRTLIVGEPKNPSSNNLVHFVTKDHSPSCASEGKRLRAGIEAGLNYSLPQCSINRFWLKVGDYRYAVSRSLEGTFATSKGITSEADLTRISLSKMMSERTDGMMIIASDGIFEVLDTELVAKEALKMRKDGLAAKDTAKYICGLALDNNTSDNVSVVVVYFDN